MLSKLREIEIQYWQNYLSNLPQGERPFQPHVVASYAGNQEITDGLLHLYLTKKKTAGSSIV